MKRAKAFAWALAAMAAFKAALVCAFEEPAAAWLSVVNTRGQREADPLDLRCGRPLDTATSASGDVFHFVSRRVPSAAPIEPIPYAGDAMAPGPGYDPAACESGAMIGGDDGCPGACGMPCATDDGLACGHLSIFSPSRWKFTVGALFMYRFVQQSRALTQDFLSGDELIDSRDVQRGWAAGPRIDAIYFLRCRWNMELLYFGMANWSRTRQVHSDFDQFTAPTISQDMLFSDVSARASSRLHNAEINLRWEFTPRITPFMGFRFVEFRDFATVEGTSEFGTAQTESTLTNDLYGFQTGVRFDFFRPCSPLSFKPYVKGAVCNNHIRRSQADLESAIFLNDVTSRDADDHVAFVGEVGGQLTYKLTECFGFFAGCEAMWLTGVARASDDLGAAVVRRSINASATELYLGAMVGIQGGW